MLDNPTHVVAIICKERWDNAINEYYTAYRAVCTCPWKGQHHRADVLSNKTARKYAEHDGAHHYNTHRYDAPPT